jgi:hypothetical protein
VEEVAKNYDALRSFMIVLFARYYRRDKILGNVRGMQHDEKNDKCIRNSIGGH